jgi:DNA replication and repair protein RecF
LQNVRCHETFKIDLGPRVTLVVGGNGAGKTSVLEAIHVGLRGTSPRTASPREMIRHGREFLRVELELHLHAGVDVLPRVIHAAAALDVRGEKRATADGAALPDFRRWEEMVPLGSFFPDSLRLIKGSPVRRRRWMDEMASNHVPAYAGSLRNYQQAMDQRNHLLRQAVVGWEHGPWETILAREGLTLAREREKSLAAFAPLFVAALSRVGGGAANGATLTYRTNTVGLVESTYRERLAEMRESDRRRGYTHLGPHRDDLRVSMRGVDVREGGSQGEQRTAMLALLLAERESTAGSTGLVPLLLLDDVMSELDGSHRRALVSMLFETGQSVITATDTHHFTSAELAAMQVVAL